MGGGAGGEGDQETFALSQSGTNYGIEWMGLSSFNYHDFQPKTTHPKDSWGIVYCSS